jgi:hypothetical protein
LEAAPGRYFAVCLKKRSSASGARMQDFPHRTPGKPG